MTLPKANRHGMTVFDYVGKLREQGGVCAVCRNPPVPGVVFQWDHDHRHCPGQQGCRTCVRGLVCSTCNSRIAVIENALRFDPQPVLDYLAKWAG